MMFDIKKIAFFYYSKKNIQHALFSEAKNREIVPCYLDNFGKRPDSVEYEKDINAFIEKGATSFHCSEELWKNPLEISTGMSSQEMNELRIGWDLLLDIDCDYLDYSKIAAELLIEALQFHNIKNFGLKFSGRSGFHIGLAFKAFPKKLNDIVVKNLFPEGPRIIASYLKEMIKKQLASEMLKISDLKEMNEKAKYKEKFFEDEGNFNPFSLLEIDTILISPRHLFRMPYSLNEKSGLASIVINSKYLRQFKPSWARPSPSDFYVKKFLPEPEEGEAKFLLMQALDWQVRQKKVERKIFQTKEVKDGRKSEMLEIKEVKEEFLPPCMKKIMQGMKQDGRKRALFIMINFFSSLDMPLEEIEKKIEEWNVLNYRPLRKGYIDAQISWFKRNKRMMPPNCERYYKDIAVCIPDFLCNKIKNPVNYFMRRARMAKMQEQEGSKKEKKRMIEEKEK